MPIRLLVLVLLLGATCAHAASPKKPAAAAQPAPVASAADIDVDAMARAKDVGATPVAVDATTASDVPAASATEVAAQATDPAPPMQTDTPPPTTSSDTAAPASAVPSPAEQRLAAGCEAHATRLLDAAQKGDYKTATRDFDSTMRTALPPEKFRQAWESLARFGALQARGQSHLAKMEGYVAVTVPLIFEKANLYAQIACGNDGRVAGFYVKPLEMPSS